MFSIHACYKQANDHISPQSIANCLVLYAAASSTQRSYAMLLTLFMPGRATLCRSFRLAAQVDDRSAAARGELPSGEISALYGEGWVLLSMLVTLQGALGNYWEVGRDGRMLSCKEPQGQNVRVKCLGSSGVNRDPKNSGPEKMC